LFDLNLCRTSAAYCYFCIQKSEIDKQWIWSDRLSALSFAVMPVYMLSIGGGIIWKIFSFCLIWTSRAMKQGSI